MKVIKYNENKHDLTVTIQLKVSEYEYSKFNIQRFDLSNLTQYTQDYLSVEHIIAVVCKSFNIRTTSIKKMKESGRLLKKGNLVDIRRLCYYFMREYTDLSLTEIASHFNQGHANVIYHLRCIDDWRTHDSELVKTIQKIDNRIKREIKNRDKDES